MQQEPSDNGPPVGLDPPWHPPTEATEPFTLPEEPRRGPRGHTALAWALIILIVAVRLVLLAVVKEDTEGADLVGHMIMRIQGRYIVGAAAVTGGGPALYSQAQAFYDGTVGQRLRFVVLAAELAGPKEARRMLDDLAGLIHTEEEKTAHGAHPFQPQPEDVQAMALLRKLYASPSGEDEEAGPSEIGAGGAAEPAERVNTEALTKEERATLVRTLGWFGELALAPPGTKDVAARREVLAPARRTFFAVVAAVSAAGIVGVGGFVGLIAMLVLAMLGRLRSGIARGPSHPGIYAETFAVWLLVFFVLQVGAEMLGLLAPGVPELVMGAVLIAFFLSLIVLGWPVLRGIPWAQVRTDIGWTVGRTRSAGAWLLEALIGLGCYAMTLPLLAVGLLLTLLLLLLQQWLAGPQPTFAPAGGPIHPIIVELSEGNVRLIVLVLVLGSIAAPIVEETMFRGVLYRHLRDLSATLGFVASVVFSTVLTAFIFALIHPQGWVAIPALMGLAIGFTLAREWRGTLIPCLVMHGVSNGIVLGMVVLLAAR